MGPACRNALGATGFEGGISYVMVKSTLTLEIMMLRLCRGFFSVQCRSRIRHVIQREVWLEHIKLMCTISDNAKKVVVARFG